MIITHNEFQNRHIHIKRLLDDLALAGLPRPSKMSRTQQPFDFVAVFPEGTDRAAVLAVIEAHDGDEPTERQKQRTAIQTAAQAQVSQLVGTHPQSWDNVDVMRALVAVMYKAGAFDEFLTVKPLADWLRR